MQEVAQREMRLVHTGDGWATALEGQTSANMGAIGVVAAFVFSAAMVGTITMDNPVFILAAMPTLLSLFGVLPARKFTRLALDSHGIHIADLHTRRVRPTLDQVRSGADPAYSVVPFRGDTYDLRFSEMRSLGFTDYSIWFEMESGRVEIALETTRRSDIERLHDEIREVWSRHRDGLEVSEGEATAQRARLASATREV